MPFNKPKTLNKKIDRLIYNDQELVENQQIAAKFNEHFTSIGIMLTNKIHSSANFFSQISTKTRNHFDIMESIMPFISSAFVNLLVYDNIDAYILFVLHAIYQPVYNSFMFFLLLTLIHFQNA